MTDLPASPAPASPTSLSGPVLDFLARPNFLTIATLDPDGAPRQAVIWFLLDGQELVINSAVGRRWPSNLLRDPRVGLAITDPADGYRWVGSTGRARPLTDQRIAQADIASMARRYHGDDPAEVERSIRGFAGQQRITFRIALDAVHDHLA